MDPPPLQNFLDPSLTILDIIQASMIRKYHNREEEPQKTNSHNTQGIQLKKKSKQLSVPNQDYCKSKRGTKYRITKQGPNTEPPQTMGAAINNDSTTHQQNPT